MKIGEAQQIYRQQVKEYREQRAVLSKQLQSVRSKMEHFQDKDGQFASEAATLELTIGALDEKEDEYQEYLDRLADKYCAHWNATRRNSRQMPLRNMQLKWEKSLRLQGAL